MVDLNAMSDRSIARPLDGNGTVPEPGVPAHAAPPPAHAVKALAGHAVHLFTALGIVPVFLATAELFSPAPSTSSTPPPRSTAEPSTTSSITSPTRSSPSCWSGA
jgi:hypothetical protein